MSNRGYREQDHSGWPGPLALVLAGASWIVPILGSVLAAVALTCGAVSLHRSRTATHRPDWMAITGMTLAGVHLFVTVLLLLTESTSG